MAARRTSPPCSTAPSRTVISERSPQGFTLIEIMIALAIGGIVVLMAHGAFGVAADMSMLLDRTRTANDEVMVTHRTLARLLGSADAATTGSLGFHGIPQGIVFSAWDRDSLRAEEVAVRGGRITVTSGGDTLRLMRTAGFAADYLLSYGADAAWVQGWESPASAPLAVRLRIASADSSGTVDTLLLVIGPRG